MVAYNLLRREGQAQRWNVPLFVTLGSPLAVTAIRAKLAPNRRPPCVGRWLNALDERDVVALYPLDAQSFPVDPPIVNIVRAPFEGQGQCQLDTACSTVQGQQKLQLAAFITCDSLSLFLLNRNDVLRMKAVKVFFQSKRLVVDLRQAASLTDKKKKFLLAERFFVSGHRRARRQPTGINFQLNDPSH